MITIGRYTFKDEDERKADYRRRVGPLRRPRTNTVERPEPEQTLAEWLAYIKARHIAEWEAYIKALHLTKPI